MRRMYEWDDRDMSLLWSMLTPQEDAKIRFKQQEDTLSQGLYIQIIIIVIITL